MLQQPIEPTEFTSVRYGERLAEIAATPSIGSVGDSFDCQTVFTWFRKNRVDLTGAL